MAVETRTRPCLNCDHALSTERFCPACGQATRLGKITFRETVGDFLNGTLSLQGAFVKTLVMLCTRPGRLFREYLAGKRQRYYKPVPFFIVNTAIYLLLSTAIGYDPLEGTNIAITYQQEVTMQAQTQAAAQFMVRHINHIMLFLVLSIGVLARLLFRRRYNLAEFLAVAFFVAAIYTVFAAGSMLLTHFVNRGAKNLNFVALVAYITVVFPAFLADRRLVVWAKSATLAVLSVLAYVLLGFGFSFLMVLLRS